MQIEQRQWTAPDGWRRTGNGDDIASPQLVLVFGGTEELSDSQRYAELRGWYPDAKILSCSTSGEILGTSVYDDSVTATAISFESTEFKVARINIGDAENSFKAGESLMEELPQEGLVHVFVISDGQRVNGSELVKGLSSRLRADVSITGGLAGDGTKFQKTLVGLDGVPSNGNIVVIGFYGDRLKVGYGSMGGWDSFGPDRVITRSEGNKLYELDGQSALSLYKKYLGELASELPGSALLFPLSIRTNDEDTPVVRTILAVSEEEESMTFAGDLPQGAYARLMKANFDRLIDGASGAANESSETIGGTKPDLAILISCVGRKVVLGQRTEEEVESVREVLGDDTVLTGFYSYGEISPFTKSTKCELHNQTMTITTLSER